jgi:hypothetical protein
MKSRKLTKGISRPVGSLDSLLLNIHFVFIKLKNQTKKRRFDKCYRQRRILLVGKMGLKMMWLLESL